MKKKQKCDKIIHVWFFNQVGLHDIFIPVKVIARTGRIYVLILLNNLLKNCDKAEMSHLHNFDIMSLTMGKLIITYLNIMQKSRKLIQETYEHQPYFVNGLVTFFIIILWLLTLYSHNQ